VSENYSPWAIVWHSLCDLKFSRFDNGMSQTDTLRDTHTQAQDDSIYHTSTVSHGKNVTSVLQARDGQCNNCNNMSLC